MKGKVLEITQRGFVCLDESMRFMVNAFQSERKPHGEPSMLDPSLQQEVDHFLKSVQVRPLSAASEGR
ncbi:MAG: hypothetical protein ACT4O5_07825 [Gammaproteobacteria bacterium]